LALFFKRPQSVYKEWRTEIKLKAMERKKRRKRKKNNKILIMESSRATLSRKLEEHWTL
jgi:hypothetical protein